MLDPAWVALSLSQHIGGKTLRALLHHFDQDTGAILQADEASLRAVPGVGPAIARSIRQIDLEQVQRDMARWQKNGIAIITTHDPAYPSRLRKVSDAPPTLFVRGVWRSQLLARAVAIVGTRSPSNAAESLAGMLGTALTEQGYAVVSGLATGVDTAAHRGTLTVPGAYPIVVLGSGVLNPYPPANRALAQGAIRVGALCAEVGPDTRVSPSALVARNRIISGLCQAVIVVETAADGGAMHAARAALRQGRTLYVLENSASGNQELLKDGARPLRTDLSNLEL